MPQPAGATPIVRLPRRTAAGRGMRGLPSAVQSLEAFGVAFICVTETSAHPYVSPAAREAIGIDAERVLSALDRYVSRERAARRGRRGAASRREDGSHFVLPDAMPEASWHLRWLDDIAVAVLQGNRGSVARCAFVEALLTERERQVARLIAIGASTKEIASRLAISPHTARRHTERVFQKCGVKCRAALAGMMAIATSSQVQSRGLAIA